MHVQKPAVRPHTWLLAWSVGRARQPAGRILDQLTDQLIQNSQGSRGARAAARGLKVRADGGPAEAAARSSGPQRARRQGGSWWPWGARDGVQGHASAGPPGHHQGQSTKPRATQGQGTTRATKRPTNPAPGHLLVFKEHNPTTNNPFLMQPP